MSEITKRLQQMSNQLGYEGREEERKAIIKEHLMDDLVESEYTLQDIAEEHEQVFEWFYEWMPYSYDIYLFFDIDILLAVNDFLEEHGPTEGYYVTDWELIDNYAYHIVFENIHQWAEEEKKGVTNV